MCYNVVNLLIKHDVALLMVLVDNNISLQNAKNFRICGLIVFERSILLSICIMIKFLKVHSFLSYAANYATPEFWDTCKCCHKKVKDKRKISDKMYLLAMVRKNEVIAIFDHSALKSSPRVTIFFRHNIAI